MMRPRELVSIATNSRGRIIVYNGLRKMLYNKFEAAGIDKKSNPHIFRHSRATDLARHLTEFQMNQRFGWVQGSDMPRTYVHLSGRDVGDAMLELHGLAPRKDAQTSSPLTPRRCTPCHTLNAPENNTCQHCGKPLDAVAALDAEKKTADNERDVAELLRDDRIRELVMQVLAEKNRDRQQPDRGH